MKKFILLFSALALPTFAQATDPKVVVSPVDHVFVPKGFDNNDNVEVVVTGKFPSPCFIKNKVDVVVKGDKIIVNVTALESAGSNTARCTPMPVPYKEEVTIGNLQGGNYKLIVNPGTKYEQVEKLNVAISSSDSVDDHLYAQVEYVELGFTGGWAGHAILMGKSPSSCLAFDRIEYLSNGKDTLAVLPIMKRISNDCVEKTERFEADIHFNVSTFRGDKILLFVRSMEGKSVNSLIMK